MRKVAERREDLDLRLLHFLLQSHYIRFSAEGRVVHEPGVPFMLHSLEIDGSLNAVGRAAAIMAQIGLIEGERDEFGYFTGIEFEVRGTVAEPETDFDDIIFDAATGMIMRGFFHPFSALISNLIYLRTTRDDPEPGEIERLRRRRELGPTRRIF